MSGLVSKLQLQDYFAREDSMRDDLEDLVLVEPLELGGFHGRVRDKVVRRK